MEQICNDCGSEANTLDENGICFHCSNINGLDEQDLFETRNNSPFYVEPIYEAGGELP